MPWAAAASIGGALISSSAAGDAADTQAASTREGTAEQRRQYNQTRSDQQPYRATGNAALDQMRTLLGVGTGGRNEQNFNADRYLALNPDAAQYMADSGRSAWDHYVEDGSRRQGDFWYGDGSKSPEFGSYARPLTAGEVQLDPGYEFARQQGQQALDRKTAAAGGRISGAALKAASQYNTDYATTGYSTAYNRQNQARSDRLNRLAALAGIGQTSVQQTGAAGQNAANAISGMATAQGNASGAATMAQGNIWGNTGNQLAALYGRNSGSGVPSVSDGGYSIGQGSAYGGTYDPSGSFTPNRAGM